MGWPWFGISATLLAVSAALEVGPTTWNAGADIMFGQSAAFTGPASALGTQMRLGMYSALAECNANAGALGGPTFGLISYDDGYEPDPSRTNTQTLINDHSVFALVGEVGTPTSSVAMPVAIDAQVPFIGPFTGAKFLRRPFQRYVVNYRASYIDETAAMVKLFVDEFKMARVSIFYQADGFGAAGLEGVELALKSRRMNIHSRGTYQRNTVEIQPGLDTMLMSEPPEAVVMIGAYAPLSAFVQAAKVVWPNCYFSTVSFVGSENFAALLGTAEARDRVYVTQAVDFPTDATVPIVAEYHTALAAHDASAEPSFTSLEGYIVGRMACTVATQVALANSGVVTREAFLDHVYNSGVVLLGTYRLGPFGGACEQVGTGCECNQGQRQVFGTKINADGSFAKFPALDFQFQTCGFQLASSSAVVFGQTAALTGPASALGLGMQLGILAAFKEANDNNMLGHLTLELLSYDDGYEPGPSEANARRLIEEDRVFALIGGVGTPTAKVAMPVALENHVPFIGAFTGAKFLRWDFKPEVVNLRASYIDETVAMVTYYVQQLRLRKIGLFIQNDSYGLAGWEGVDIALRAHGMMIYSEGRYTRNTLEVEDGLAAVFEHGNPDAVIMIGAYAPLAKFIKLAKVIHEDCHFASVSFVGSNSISGLLETAENRRNVLITQVVPLPTDTSKQVVVNYQAAINAYDSSAEPGFVSLEGYMVGKLAVRVLSGISTVARQAFLSAVYGTGTFPVATDMRLGPYEWSSGNSSGCNQGMRKVYLTRMRGDGDFEYVSEFPELSFPDSCGLTNMDCIAGYYRHAAEEVCQLCLPGNMIQDGRCVQCPVGSKGGATSSEPCELCPAGEYSSQPGQTACEVCLSGTYSGQAGMTECRNCSRGTAQVLPRMTSCDECEVGQFASSEGLSECSPCRVGTYADEVGHSECHRCGNGTESVAMWTSMQRVGGADHTSGEWVLLQGATTSLACGCQKGTILNDAGECESCMDGLDCRGMSEALLEEGYYATSGRPNWVFRCYGTDFIRCPGGLPGTCAAGRENTSLACVQCQTGMRPQSGGVCEECAGSDLLPFFAVALGILVALSGMYYLVDTENHAKQSNAVLLVVIAGGQLIAYFQQLGVLSTISLEWPEPFASILQLVTILNFDIDILPVGCVASVSAVSRFAGRMFAVVLFFIVMCVIHVIAVFALHRGRFREQTASLIGSTGTIFMAFFIAIVSSTLAPFQCNNNPNGVLTVRSYPTVVCWSNDYPEHKDMVGLGVAANLIPTAFLSVAIWVVLKFPEKMRKGDTGFLHAYAFLFFRFRSGAHWFVLVFLIRNLLVAVTPVLWDVVAQVVFMQCVLLPCFAATVKTAPWRVSYANILDAMTSCGMVMLLCLSAFYIDDVNPKVIAILCCILFGIVMFGIVCAMLAGFYERFLRNSKPFKFFICHHKQGAGNFARLLKMTLIDKLQDKNKRVFIDSDDLKDLSNLFQIVSSQSDSIIALNSKELFNRPWCMGELTTARLNRVWVSQVIMPDFQPPEEDFIIDYAKHVADIRQLAKFGISLEDCQDTMRWLRELPQTGFPAEVHMPALDELCKRLLSGKWKGGASLKEASKSDEDMPTDPCSPIEAKPAKQAISKVMILVDHRNSEAVCTAFVVKKLITPLFVNDLSSIPEVLEPGNSLPDKTDQALCICTNGCFKQVELALSLLECFELQVGVLPVIAESAFRFPTRDFYKEMQKNEVVHRSSSGQTEGKALIKIVMRIFGEIAIEVNPQESEEILKVRAHNIFIRLQNGVARLADGDGNPLGNSLSETASAMTANDRRLSHLSVTSANVFESHGCIIRLPDSSSGGTILWV